MFTIAYFIYLFNEKKYIFTFFPFAFENVKIGMENPADFCYTFPAIIYTEANP